MRFHKGRSACGGTPRGVTALLLVSVLLVTPASSTRGQGLDSLVALASASNPQIRAARERVRAAEARVSPAGARPDPMLMAGVQNFPLSEPGFGDFMTMKMVGVSQMIPAPGKLASSRRVAEREVDAALAEVDAARHNVSRAVKTAYYDIAYLDQALAIVARTQDVLVQLIRATEARYETGSAGQGDVLRARVETARLGEDASAIHEERRAAVARLNAMLDRQPGTPLGDAAIPMRIARAAVSDSPGTIQFVSATLGSRAANSPLPPVDSLVEVAVRQNATLRAHEAMIGAQAARAQLARLERRPDIDVSLQYGQRDGFPDMISAVVSLPLPLQRARKQDQLAAAARAELAGLEAEHRQRRNDIRADITRLHAQLERNRTQLALLVKAVLPQSRAALEATVISYQAGRGEFVTVLESRAMLFNSETAYFRALSDFAKMLAELEEIVGGEILP